MSVTGDVARWLRDLAPKKVETAVVVGTGVQARLQMLGAYLVRPFERVLMHGRDMDKARACAADLCTHLGIETEAMADPAQDLRSSTSGSAQAHPLDGAGLQTSSGPAVRCAAT